jgi:hypothetical protein
MKFEKYLPLLGSSLSSVAVADCFGNYRAVAYTTSNGTWMPYDKNTALKLSSDGITPSVAFLDYGHDVEGLATFDVARRFGNTSVFEMTYSETRALVDSAMVSENLIHFLYKTLNFLGRWPSSTGCCYGHVPDQPIQYHR